jgi:hypothetical protein
MPSLGTPTYGYDYRSWHNPDGLDVHYPVRYGKRFAPDKERNGVVLRKEITLTATAPVTTLDWHIFNYFKLDVGVSTTLSFSNPRANSDFVIVLQKDGSANPRQVFFPVGMDWGNQAPITTLDQPNQQELITVSYFNGVYRGERSNRYGFNNALSGAFDARGTFAGRSAFDGKAQGFIYLATDVNPLQFYIRNAGIGTWDGPFRFSVLNQEVQDEVNVEAFLPAGFNNVTDNATSYIQAALSSGKKTVKFNKRYLRCDTITVPADVSALDVNLQKITQTGNIVLVNTGSKVTGKIRGTGAVSSPGFPNQIERGVYPAVNAVTDVFLDLDVSNINLAVHGQPLSGLYADRPKRWRGYVYAHDIVGGLGYSEGYAVLLSPATDCTLTVVGTDVVRHVLYLSAGSKNNICDVIAERVGNYVAQLNAYAGQEFNEYNTIRVKAKDCYEYGAALSGGAAIVGGSHRNTISVDMNGGTANAVRVEGVSGVYAQTPQDNIIENCHITGAYTGPIILAQNCHNTQIKNNALAATSVVGVAISDTQSGTNAGTMGAAITGNASRYLPRQSTCYDVRVKPHTQSCQRLPQGL